MVGPVKSALPTQFVQRPQALTRDQAAGQNPVGGPTRGAAALKDPVAASGTARIRDAILFGASAWTDDDRADVMNHALATLASAKIDGRRSAAQALQDAERKLIRLRMQVRAAIESGNRKAAASLAVELAAVAQDLAAAARDYAAAAGSAPGIVTGDASESADASDAGGLAQEASAAPAEVSQAAAPASTENPDRAQADSTADGAETITVAVSASSGSPDGNPNREVQAARDAQHDTEFLDAVHRLLDESKDLFHAMKRLAEAPVTRAVPGEKKG